MTYEARWLDAPPSQYSDDTIVFEGPGWYAVLVRGSAMTIVTGPWADQHEAGVYAEVAKDDADAEELWCQEMADGSGCSTFGLPIS